VSSRRFIEPAITLGLARGGKGNDGRQPETMEDNLDTMEDNLDNMEDGQQCITKPKEL